jgi:succinylglutamate desuccinylase
MNQTASSSCRLEPASHVFNPQAHVLAAIRGPIPGPTLIILGGIHGNEPAGVLAAARVAPRLRAKEGHLRGEIALLRGNARALARKVRYIDEDLNRQWTAENVWICESPDTSSTQRSELKFSIRRSHP